MFWFWFLVGAVVFYFLFRQKPKQSNARKNAPSFTWPELPEYGTAVVGESNYQPALKAIVGNKQKDYEVVPARALLILEDDNPHDKNAVQVEISGMTVGYLSRQDAKRYRAALAKEGHGNVTAECSAGISGGFTLDNGGSASFGVYVCIPPLETA